MLNFHLLNKTSSPIIIRTMLTNDLDKTQTFETLKRVHHAYVPDELSPDRIAKQVVRNGALTFSYAGYLLSDSILDHLQALADEQHITARYVQILDGDRVNKSENRQVLHHKTRSKDRGFYGAEQQRFSAFAENVRRGQHRGFSGKPFKQVVHVGIGGSELGPRALYQGLINWASAENRHILPVYFMGNVDPDESTALLSTLNVEETLFVLISKSGTTQETTANLEAISREFSRRGHSLEAVRQHMVFVTGKSSAMDNPQVCSACFYLDDAIGGRYSSTSSVGGVTLSIAFGPDVFETLLSGAFDQDQWALEPNIRQNMAALSAVLTIWERNICGYSSRALIPYSQALEFFPSHLQQLDCESNGKQVNVRGEFLNYHTSPVIFGEPGTKAQHSFFQKLHQGSDVIPIQFIGLSQAQFPNGEVLQTKLNENLAAQMVALSTGQQHQDPNKIFLGKRPHSVVLADQLTPFTLGSILAFYENKIMFEGFLWNINSFDQEGVQLGKTLALSAANHAGEKWPLLSAYLELFTV